MSMIDDKDLSSVKTKAGRPVRSYVYVVTTNKNHDRLCWPEVFRAPRAWLMFLAAACLSVTGSISWLFAAVMMVAAVSVFVKRQASFPVILTILALGYIAVYLYDAHLFASVGFVNAGLYFLAARAWALAPDTRDPSAKHCLMLYTANGYWHSDQYISGVGEITNVLTQNGDPVPAAWNLPIAMSHAGIDRDEESVRAVKTYRRKPGITVPFGLYPMTSTGYCMRRLGINDLSIRCPGELLDYCEAGVTVETQQYQSQSA